MHDKLDVGTIAAGVALFFMFWIWAALVVIACTPEDDIFYNGILTNKVMVEDFTDTGVGCIDDCLEPMVQDEADTTESKERN